MSPEQASGRRVTAASDIYSLGTVFYEMLTGQPAFKGATPLETIRMVAQQEARRPSTIQQRMDRDLETICLKCLEKTPSSRYPSAGALADDLDRWSRREPIKARTTGPVLRISRWVRRNPVGAALIISLLFGLGATLMLLKMAQDGRTKSDGQVAAVNQEFLLAVQELWENPKETHVHIRASELATLANLSPPRISPDTMKLIFAKRISQSPDGQAIAFAPVLRLLEERMAKQLDRAVVFDLRFYKLSGGGVQRPVAEGEVDFQRMGPVAYLRSEQAGHGLVPVVHEKSAKEAVIFARADAGISSLSQVAGRRVAFGHTNSDLSCLAKYHLATNGIGPARLKYFENLERMDLPAQAEGSADSDYHAHKEVIRRILNGDFDIGESQRKHFESNRHRGRRLVELFSFIVPPDLYVAKAGLATNVIAAFQEALVALNSDDDLKLLERIESPRVTGFVAITNGYFDSLRYALTNLVIQFDTPAVNSAAAPSPAR